MHNEYIQQEHFAKWKGVDSTPAYPPQRSLGQSQGLGFSKGHLYILKRTEWVLWLVGSAC